MENMFWKTYYGYKIHIVTTIEAYIIDFIINKISIDDKETLGFSKQVSWFFISVRAKHIPTS